MALLATGCDTECRGLCTSWYDYLRDVCQELDTDDDRVRCISDYRVSRVSETEIGQCRDQEAWIDKVRAMPVGERECLCDGDDSDCPDTADDDDSAAP